MSVTVFGAEKGGVGKSTLTQNMAAIRAELGYRVVIADFDNQGTCSKWVSRRDEHAALPKVSVRRLDDPKQRASIDSFGALIHELSSEYDDVFVDVGGSDSAVFRASLAVADKVIVPLKPSLDDLDTVPDLVDLTRKIDALDIRIVLNMASKPAILRWAQGVLEGFKDVLPTMPKVIGDRAAFIYAKNHGMGVGELSRADGYDATAAIEIKDLYLGVWGK